MKTFHIIGTVAVTGAILVLGPVGSATAADTTTTFSLTSGSLSVTAASSAALTNAATGATSVSGPLGAIEVTDARGTTAGWTVSAASTTFTSTTGTTTTTSTGVSYNSGTFTAKTGTVTPTSTGATSITTVAAPVAAGTLASGNNTATYSPDLTVTLPATALAGSYTGTVTTSVS